MELMIATAYIRQYRIAELKKKKKSPQTCRENLDLKARV